MTPWSGPRSARSATAKRQKRSSGHGRRWPSLRRRRRHDAGRLLMAILVRRSNLLAPITDAERVNQAWRSDADAITLDLEDGVVETRKAEARGLVKEGIALAGQ